MATPNKQLKTGAELELLLEQLEDPFDPSEIKWRVTHTTRDSSRGAVVAFADPRAYTDRLNRIFTPSGWTRTYDVSEVTSLSRIKREKMIQTGKVLVTCALAIGALGAHTGCGEEWADEENALTSAEAQAFKRASSCFGLGRYLYNFVEMWVPLNEQRQPMTLPQLPKWALPKALGGGGRAHPPRPVGAQRGPIDQKTTARIEGFRRVLGNEIYREVLWRAADADRAEAIPNAQLQQNVMEAMERAARGIRRANSVAEQIGETPFIAVLDRLQISSMTDIPRLELLKALVAELEREVGRPAA
jgi:hypothetical protein